MLALVSLSAQFMLLALSCNGTINNRVTWNYIGPERNFERKIVILF